MIEFSLRGLSMTNNKSSWLFCIKIGNLSLSREKIPVKNVKISIAKFSLSLGFFRITYGSSNSLFSASLVRFMMLIS